MEEVDFHGENCVDAEWMAYLGAFRYLRALKLAGCRGINNSALWSITGMDFLFSNASLSLVSTFSLFSHLN